MKVPSICQRVGSLLAMGTNKLMIGSPEIVKKLILLIHVLSLKEQLAGQRIHLEENVGFFCDRDVRSKQWILYTELGKCKLYLGYKVVLVSWDQQEFCELAGSQEMRCEGDRGEMMLEKAEGDLSWRL